MSCGWIVWSESNSFVLMAVEKRQRGGEDNNCRKKEEIRCKKRYILLKFLIEN